MEKLLLPVFLLLGFYAVIPTVLARVFGIGVFKKATAEHQFTLTFDDGPDPVYTPLLLEILRKHQIQATFFVLGQKAEHHPELLQQIHQEGHLIGIHHYTHIANWLLSPFQIRKRINHTANIVEKIIGVRPVYYRPPWGLVTVVDWFFYKRYRIVLWSLMVGDWTGKKKQKSVGQKLIKGVENGSIIVLHDSGETFGAADDAPMYMMEALQFFLKETQSKGYTCVRMDYLLDPSHRSVSRC